MTDTSKLIERLRAAAAHRAGTDKRLSLPEDFIESQAADEIEDLQKKLDACRAGFDRLARQVDGYKRAGKLAIDQQLRKKP